jgi:4-coumarate--CoA ligase
MPNPQRIYNSTYGPLSVPTDASVAQFLAKYDPDDVPSSKVIISDFDDPTHTLTFGAIRDEPARGATGLINVLGVKEGDVVCIFGHNSVNWALLAHSIMWAGAVFA